MPSSVASKRMPSSTRVQLSPSGGLDLDRHDLASNAPRLVAAIALWWLSSAIAVELVLREAVLLRHHLGAHELAELDAGIALLDPRALRRAEPVLGGQLDGRAHRHAASCSRRPRRSPRPARPTSRPAPRTAAPAATSRTGGRSHVPGTLSGSFEASTALRATLPACSPTWLTQPMITSSISAGSACARVTSSSRTLPAISAGCHPDSRPALRPAAVRTAATI